MQILTDLTNAFNQIARIWTQSDLTHGEMIVYGFISFFLVGFVSIFIYSFFLTKSYKLWQWDSLKRNFFIHILVSAIIGFISISTMIYISVFISYLSVVLRDAAIPFNLLNIFMGAITYNILLLFMVKFRNKKISFFNLLKKSGAVLVFLLVIILFLGILSVYTLAPPMVLTIPIYVLGAASQLFILYIFINMATKFFDKKMYKNLRNVKQHVWWIFFAVLLIVISGIRWILMPLIQK